MILTWSEVVETHRSWRGISVLDGRVRSLLCNQHKAGGYSDVVLSDRIVYRVTASTLPVDVHALTEMIGRREPVEVFEKLGVNMWKPLGPWVVAEAERTPTGIDFTLLPAAAHA